MTGSNPEATTGTVFNTILYWRSGDEQHPRVLAPDDTSRTSIAYRQRMAQLLATDEFPGTLPYFKVEGWPLRTVSSCSAFGRKANRTKIFSTGPKIIGVSYRVEQTGTGERIRLADDWTIINDFVIAKTDSTLPRPLALSSLEYDPFQRRFWMLTSQEANGQLDAYLWTISPDDLYGRKPFTLIRTPQGQPLHVGHKAEDVTPLDRSRLLLIHDDDRGRTTVNGKIRQPNQAAYTILTFP